MQNNVQAKSCLRPKFLLGERGDGWGDEVMDGAGVTVKEAWIKAKVVCRKKGVQVVLSPLPPPHFPTR